MIKQIVSIIFGMTFVMIYSAQDKPEYQGLARHELYWEYTDVWYNFDAWSQTYNQPSSKRSREYIRAQNYRTMLDVGAGVCPEYFGFQKEGYFIEYQAIDCTPRIVAYGQEREWPLQFGTVENINAADNAYEVVYARHLLEHVRYYKKALQHMIRVAEKEVLIVFFLEPSSAPDKIDYSMQEKSALFNNRYNKEKLEAFLKGISKVKEFWWESLQDTTPDGNEALLHIIL
jgi:ubiquinone/menaquinone biosynthesis C-methylase UbiE